MTNSARAVRTALATAALSIGVLTASCKSTETALPADGTSAVQLKDVLITIERTPCFGTCPVYSLSLTGEGVVTFKGERFVRTIGEATATVSTDSVAALVKEIRDAGYFEMAESYTPNIGTCGMHHTDAPTVTTSVKIDTQSRRIVNYHGCSGTPAALRKVEDSIDRIAGTQRWLNPS